MKKIFFGCILVVSSLLQFSSAQKTLLDMNTSELDAILNSLLAEDPDLMDVEEGTADDTKSKEEGRIQNEEEMKIVTNISEEMKIVTNISEEKIEPVDEAEYNNQVKNQLSRYIQMKNTDTPLIAVDASEEVDVPALLREYLYITAFVSSVEENVVTINRPVVEELVPYADDLIFRASHSAEDGFVEVGSKAYATGESVFELDMLGTYSITIEVLDAERNRLGTPYTIVQMIEEGGISEVDEIAAVVEELLGKGNETTKLDTTQLMESNKPEIRKEIIQEPEEKSKTPIKNNAFTAYQTSRHSMVPSVEVSNNKAMTAFGTSRPVNNKTPKLTNTDDGSEFWWVANTAHYKVFPFYRGDVK